MINFPRMSLVHSCLLLSTENRYANQQEHLDGKKFVGHFKVCFQKTRSSFLLSIFNGSTNCFFFGKRMFLNEKGNSGWKKLKKMKSGWHAPQGACTQEKGNHDGDMASIQKVVMVYSLPRFPVKWLIIIG